MAQLIRSLELQALGTEPFWSVEITSEGMTYRAPEHPDGIVFPYAAPAIEDSTVSFESSRTDAMPRTLKVSIHWRPCSDGMSDRRYLYASEAWLDHVECRIPEPDQTTPRRPGQRDHGNPIPR
jgi:uncharacterized membrane protein